jgi:DNA polymerase III subunit epsilon
MNLMRRRSQEGSLAPSHDCGYTASSYAIAREERTIDAMPLELTRPLAFIDLESTGTLPERDRIVEIAILKLHPDGREDFRYKRVNPGIPIPPNATAVHSITDADVAQEPLFIQYARGVHSFLEGCDFAGFGVTRFDLPLLRAELWRTREIDFRWRDCAVIDAMAIFHAQYPRDLSAAVQFYCGRTFPGAHAAVDDARAAMDVLHAQLERHTDLPRSVTDLDRLLNAEAKDWVDHDGRFIWINGEATIAFGSNKGRLLRDLAKAEPDYLEWMLDTDFAPDVKEMIRAALGGELPRLSTSDAVEKGEQA